MLGCALTLFLLLQVPTANEDADQKEIDFEPRRIKVDAKGDMSLAEALELVGKETGSRLEFWAAQDQDVLLARRQNVDLGAKTFWEAYDVISTAWRVSMNWTDRGGALCIRPDEKHDDAWHPLRSHSLTKAVSVGAYKIVYARIHYVEKGIKLWVRVYPEPRLRYMASMDGEMMVWGEKGDAVKLAFERQPRTQSPEFTFDGSRAPKEIRKIAFRCGLAYEHDWRIEEIGPLDKLIKEKKPIKCGLYKFGVESTAMAENSEGKPYFAVNYRILNRYVHASEEFYLVSSKDQRKLEHESSSHGAAGTIQGQYQAERTIAPAELILWVRAPQKVA